MKRMRMLLCGLSAAWMLCPGCVENGLSVRETPGRDFSRYAMSLYDLPPADAAPRQPLVLPARIAVAQIGEVAPPQPMLDQLQNEKATFSSVQSIACTPDVMIRSARPGPAGASEPVDPSREQISRMLRYARDTGSDYLFLFGGTIDHASTGTGLSLADVTIIGAFTVPSKRISAEGRASGILIDARSGRVVLAVGASRTDSRMAPTAAQDTDELKLLTSVRDELTKELAEQLKARAKEAANSSKTVVS